MQYWKPSAKKAWMKRKKEEKKMEEWKAFQRRMDDALAPRKQKLDEQLKGYVKLCEESERKRRDQEANADEMARMVEDVGKREKEAVAREDFNRAYGEQLEDWFQELEEREQAVEARRQEVEKEHHAFGGGDAEADRKRGEK